MLGGVAVMDDTGLIAEARLNVKSAHSERLLQTLDACLRQASLGIRDIDVLAVGIGPGSFTGLRIALGTVKGLAYAGGKRVVSVPTLEAFAWNFPESPYPVCPLLDARKNEVYAAVFLRKGDGFERLMPECSIKAKDLVSFLGGYGKVLFAGEGALLYREELLQGLGARALFAPPHLMVPLPSSAAYLGMRLARQGRFQEPSGLVPFYIRKSEAELKLARP